MQKFILVLLMATCANTQSGASGDGASGDETSCGLSMRADIAFLLDSTHSIREENWPVMTQFIKDVVDRVNYAPDQTRIGGIQWSRKAWEMMSLDAHPTKEDLLIALDASKFRRGGGQLHKALDMLVDQTLSQNNTRPDAARIGILVIDEQSHNPTKAQLAAQRVKDSGIKMIVVGVERRRFDYNELVGIAGGNSSVLTVDSVLDLDTPEFLEKLMEVICSAAEPGEVCTDSDAWSAPIGWNGPAADYYKSFDNTDCMTLHNGAHLDTGMNGKAITTYNGLDQWVDLGVIADRACMVSPSTCGAAGGTISLWLKYLPGAYHNDYAFTSFEKKVNGQSGSGISVRNIGQIDVHVATTTTWKRIFTKYPIPSNWFHLVITLTGTKDVEIYINGQLNHGQLQIYKGNNLANVGKFVIGRKFTDGHVYRQYASIAVDDLMFWNQALTPAEVSTIYGSSKSSEP